MNTNVNSYLIERNLNYMIKIMNKDMKRGNMYNRLNRHIQINIDCEGYHELPIMKYKILEEETKKALTDKIEIIRVDLSYFVEKCYNEDADKLDYKDKFIGMIGITDKDLLENITKGEKNMEEIKRIVEDFSDDDEILGAYDAEEHRKEEEYWVMVDKLEKANAEGLASGIEQGKKEKINIVKNMLNKNIDLNIIIECTGLTQEEINKLREEMRNHFFFLYFKYIKF